MREENGEFHMDCPAADSFGLLKSPDELLRFVNAVGFLPLFSCGARGFSVEEHTAAFGWWSGNPASDPWEWREQLSKSGQVAYGKFFGDRAGYVSLEWFPVFAAYRRAGYDFDSLYEDGLASLRMKRVMDAVSQQKQPMSFELKAAAGFGKNGLKGFEGVVTKLQMMSYLAVYGFRRRKNRAGGEYGWPVSVYAAPEEVFGAGLVRSAYSVSPDEALDRMFKKASSCFPDADGSALLAALKL